jgi:SAM-dependent methyltransferase
MTALGIFAPAIARGELTVCDLYDGLGSWYYDALVDATQTDVVDFVKALRRARAKTVVDLAAGSGRITLPLAARGFDVIAVDNSQAMLDRLAERVAALPAAGGRITPVLADASEFVPEEPVDAVIIGATSICLFGPGEQRLALLRCVRRALKPGGVFLFDVATPPVRLLEGRTLTRVVPVAGGERHATSVVVRELTGDHVETVNMLVHPHPGANGPVLVTTRKNVVDLARLEAELTEADLEPVSAEPAHVAADDELVGLLNYVCRPLS